MNDLSEQFFPRMIKAVAVVTLVSCIGMGLFSLSCSRLVPVLRLGLWGKTADGIIAAFTQRRGSMFMGKSSTSFSEPAVTFKFKAGDGTWYSRTIWIDPAWDAELRRNSMKYPTASLPGMAYSWNTITVHYLPEQPDVALPEAAMRVGVGNLITAVLLFAGGITAFYHLFWRTPLSQRPDN